MTGYKKIQYQASAEPLIRLKPEKLGRYYHKVPVYIKEVAGKYPKAISDYFLSTYRINSDLRNVYVHETFQHTPQCPYNTGVGKIGFSIDRHLLAELLESYYGGSTPPTQDEPPVSASENRMRMRLGVDISNICARLLMGGEPLGHIDTYVSSYEEIKWGYCVEFVFFSHATQVESALYLYLDAHVIDEMTRRLSDIRPKPQTEHPGHRIAQLPVQLDCVLARAQLPLSSVLALKIDVILMVRLLDRCEVHIKQQKLFHGAISEDNGALFLTSLDSAKSQ